MKNSKDINKTSAQNQSQEQDPKEVKKATPFMPSMAQDEPTFDTTKEARKKGGIDAIVHNPVVIIIIAVILSVLVGKIVFSAPTMSQYTADINRHDTELQSLHKQVDPLVTKVNGFDARITDATNNTSEAKTATNGIQKLIDTSIDSKLNNAIISQLSQYAKVNDVNNVNNQLSQYAKTNDINALVNNSINSIVSSNSIISGHTTEMGNLKTQITTLTEKVTKLEASITNTNTSGDGSTDYETDDEYTSGNSQPLGLTINGSNSLSYTFKDIAYKENNDGEYIGEELSKRMSVKIVNNTTFGKQYNIDVLLYIDFNKDVDYFISDEDNFILEDEDGEWDNYGIDNDDVMLFRKEINEYFDPGEKITFSNMRLIFTPDVWSPSSESTEWDLKMVVKGLIDY